MIYLFPRLVIEPDFGQSISVGEVEIEVLADADAIDEDGLLKPIVLDINNITIVNASGWCC